MKLDRRDTVHAVAQRIAIAGDSGYVETDRHASAVSKEGEKCEVGEARLA